MSLTFVVLSDILYLAAISLVDCHEICSTIIGLGLGLGLAVEV